MADGQSHINFLFCSIIEAGIIHQNRTGRYEAVSGYEYTCGCGIEYLTLVEDEYERTQWRCSRVEHNSDNKTGLDGLNIRIRRRK